MAALTPDQLAIFEADFAEAIKGGRLTAADRHAALAAFAANLDIRPHILHGAAGVLELWVQKERAAGDEATFTTAADPLGSDGAVDSTPPEGLDAGGRELYAQVLGSMRTDATLDCSGAFAATTGTRRFDAMPSDAAVGATGGVDQLLTHARARSLARSHGIGYVDARELADLNDQVAELEYANGASDIAWLDARERPEPARPWSDDDWQVDSRRAQAHGLQLDRPTWEAATAEGRDIVHELFEQRRIGELARTQAEREEFLTTARQREETLAPRR